MQITSIGQSLTIKVFEDQDSSLVVYINFCSDLFII